MSQKYSSQLVKLLLNSIDDVEMRRLKEGFYGIMKLSNHIKTKPDYKQIVIENSLTKIEKPQTEAILTLKDKFTDNQLSEQDSSLNLVAKNTLDSDTASSSKLQLPKKLGFQKKNLTLSKVPENQTSDQTQSTQILESSQQPDNNQIIEVQVDLQINQIEEVKKPSYAPGKQRAKQKGKKQMAPPSFLKKLQLKVGGGEDENQDGNNEADLPPSLKQMESVFEEQKTSPQKQSEIFGTQNITQNEMNQTTSLNEINQIQESQVIQKSIQIEETYLFKVLILAFQLKLILRRLLQQKNQFFISLKQIVLNLY